MAVDRGLLAVLRAEPGRGEELGAFLGRELAVQQEGTVNWFASRLGDTTCGIFDTFESGEARQAHVNGWIPAALQEVGSDLLAEEADNPPIDVLAVT